MVMEFHGMKSFWSIPEDDASHRGFHSSPHSDGELSLSPPRQSTASAASPWLLSPPPPRRCAPAPAPALLYHCVASLQRQDGTVHAIAVADRGRMVLTGSDSDRVRAWRQEDLGERGMLRTRRPRVRALLAHADALFTAHADRRVRVWAMAAPSVTSSSGVRWRKIATLPSRRLRLPFFRWRQERGQQQHREEVSCLALCIAGRILYTGSWDRTVKAWRVEDGTCVDSFVAHDGRVNAVAVGQEDDGGVFTAGADGCVKVWRRVYGETTHALTMVLRFQSSPVNALVVGGGADGASGYVYSGCSDGYVNIWEREAVTGRYHHGGFLQGHRYAVLCLAAVERLVLSGSEDTTIRVWRREEGSGFHVCLAVMDGHRGPVRCIAVAVEMAETREGGMGLLVYSASLDRMLKAWRLKVAGHDMQDNEKRKVADVAAAVAAEGEEEEEEEGIGWSPERREGQWEFYHPHEMTPVLSPLWVEKKLREARLY